MRRLVLATRNPGKVRELAAMLADLDVEVVSVAAFPAVGDVVEDGLTFAANALKKAREVAAATGWPALADDSGLEVDALDGEPGVYSARYGGPGLDDAGRCAHLLAALTARGSERSAARFRSAVALVAGDEEHLCEGAWPGEVAGPPTGTNGFGYDPIFWLPGRGLTAAQLDAAEKNRLSHRGQALAAMLRLLHERPALLG